MVLLDSHNNLILFGCQYPKHPHQSGGPKFGQVVRGVFKVRENSEIIRYKIKVCVRCRPLNSKGLFGIFFGYNDSTRRGSCMDF